MLQAIPASERQKSTFKKKKGERDREKKTRERVEKRADVKAV